VNIPENAWDQTNTQSQPNPKKRYFLSLHKELNKIGWSFQGSGWVGSRGFFFSSKKLVKKREKNIKQRRP
jgi:hypothetical protein